MENRLKLAVPWVVCLSLLATTAEAQSGDSAVAQALFDQGKQLVSSGHGAEACPKFEESQRLDPRSGTLINLANCYELTKRLASAWSTFIEAATSARAAGNADREKVARERAATLVPRLSKLVISVAPALQSIQGLEITRDGVVVHAPEWGVALPADAGDHAVTAKAPGYEPFTTTASVVVERSTVTVSVPELVALPAEAPPPAPPPPPAVASPSEPAAPSKEGLGTRRTVALAAGGVGVVGVALGAAFGFASKSKHDQSNKYCSGATCTAQVGVDDSSAARTDGDISTAMMIIGGAGLAAGAALWFTAPKKNGAARFARVGFGFGSVQVDGAF